MRSKQTCAICLGCATGFGLVRFNLGWAAQLLSNNRCGPVTLCEWTALVRSGHLVRYEALCEWPLVRSDQICVIVLITEYYASRLQVSFIHEISYIVSKFTKLINKSINTILTNLITQNRSNMHNSNAFSRTLTEPYMNITYKHNDLHEHVPYIQSEI